MSADFDAFHASPAPMWVFDVETLAILDANQAAAEMYGYPLAHLLGMSILDLRPPEAREALKAYVRADPAQRVQGRVWTHLHRDGSLLHVQVRSVEADYGGRPARLVVARDISELERAQERVHLLAQAMGDAAYDYDILTTDIWFSDSFAANFGFDDRTMPRDVGQWAALIHPADQARIDTSLAAALAGGADYWVEEYCFQRGDGTYTDVLDRGYIQRDGHGTAIRMVGGMIDLRPQRLLSTRLRLLERAVQASGSGVLIADASDPAFPIVYANPAFEQITGHRAEDVEGRAFDFLQAADPQQAGAVAVREALASLGEANVALQGERRDGQPFWYEFRITPMRDATGRATHLLGLLNDTSERQRHAQQLQWRSTHDVLTGLPNRHLMLERIGQALVAAREAGAPARVAVLVVDLDEFKLVNDELGHAAGDQALCEIAARLRRVCGPGAVPARSVGDEFAILVQGDDEFQAERLASAVHAALAEPIETGPRACKLSACVGYAHFPEDAGSAESLLMSAELAMYQAKKQGRNCTVAYRGGKTPSTGKLQMLQELREALERKEFRLLFQPVFSADLRLVALEALVRWEHPRRGLLPPGEFIAICEESGLIVELGRRVLHEAARHHAFLASQGLGHVRISVNVSAMQFAHGLLEDVQAVIDEFHLPRGALELELTESVIVDDPERAAQVMVALAELGVTIAIDDFGVGYSSLSYLKRLPIHRLKIDRSFVNDLESDASDRSICEAVIALARTLRLGVVAEGVESTFQRDWLRGSGAGELQGYLFARPVSFDAAVQVAPEGVAG